MTLPPPGRNAALAPDGRTIFDTAGLKALIAGDAAMMGALEAVARGAPTNAWIGAGFVRNAVWHALHGHDPDVAGLADLDVVYFDLSDTRAARDATIEAALRAAAPDLPWSVTNQARMHTRNRHAPYRDLADAIAHWPETATAIAARLGAACVELLAPHGVDDLLGSLLRPTPAFAQRPEVMYARMDAKNWLSRWPQLRLAVQRA